jgi:hypothetical protein
MGDGLDGFGVGAEGTLALVILGIPLSLIFLIALSIAAYVRVKRLPRWISLYVLGILFGAILGLVSVLKIPADFDDCDFLDRQSRRGMYTAQERAQKRQAFQAKKCPEIVSRYEENADFNRVLVRSIGLLAPSGGLLLGWITQQVFWRSKRG